MLLGLLWSSCSNEEGIIPPSSPEKAASELRTPEEAIALADNLFASRTEGTRASSRTVKAVSIIGSASVAPLPTPSSTPSTMLTMAASPLSPPFPRASTSSVTPMKATSTLKKSSPAPTSSTSLTPPRTTSPRVESQLAMGQLSIRGTILYTNGTVSSRCSRWNGARTTPKAFIALTKLPDVYRLPWRR